SRLPGSGIPTTVSVPAVPLVTGTLALPEVGVLKNWLSVAPFGGAIVSVTEPPVRPVTVNVPRRIRPVVSGVTPAVKLLPSFTTALVAFDPLVVPNSHGGTAGTTSVVGLTTAAVAALLYVSRTAADPSPPFELSVGAPAARSCRYTRMGT